MKSIPLEDAHAYFEAARPIVTTGRSSSRASTTLVPHFSRPISPPPSGTLYDHTPFVHHIPTLTKTPWELGRTSKRMSTSLSFKARNSSQSSRSQELPQEVYDSILQHLQKLHFDDCSEGCASCYLKDLHSLSLTSRAWDKVARNKLYRSVWLCTAQDRLQPAKAKQKTQERIKLLRRTLRDRGALAKLVRELNLSGISLDYHAPRQEKEEILDQLASLVMACPSLERVRGFYFQYDHEFDRFTHALSTRTRLKEMVWNLSGHKASQASRDQFAHLYDDPTSSFIRKSENWAHLDTLFLHAQTSNCLDYRAFIATFRNLPSLRHLVVSGFTTEDFNDRTLRTLPPLDSLRLEELHGLTDAGLARFATSPAAKRLRTVSLIRLEVCSLSVVSSFLALPALERFSLDQKRPICHIPFPMPTLSAQNLQYLHWSTLIPSAATTLLARAISTGTSFPRLERIRTTSDYDGLFQNLCKPLARIAKENDLFRISRPSITLSSPSVTVTSASSVSSYRSSTSMSCDSDDDSQPCYYSTLPEARRAAQRRLDDARLKPATQIIVEEDNVVKDVYTIRQFMGRLDSKIQYYLEPDVPDSDTAIIAITDLWTARPDKPWCGGGSWSAPEVPSWNSSRWEHPMRQLDSVIDLRRFF